MKGCMQRSPVYGRTDYPLQRENSRMYIDCNVLNNIKFGNVDNRLAFWLFNNADKITRERI